MTAADTVVVFTRAPRAGTVKTRLATSLGDARALEIYRSLAEHSVREAVATGLDVVVTYAPGDAAAEMRAWLGEAMRLEPQEEGDLGARMAGAVARRFREGATRVAVIGTDCPTLRAATIHRARALLDVHDVVFGPATDGGYYLVALRAPQPTLFRDVPWSTDRTLAASLARAAEAGLRVALLDPMRDIDTAEDWAWFESWSRE